MVIYEQGAGCECTSSVSGFAIKRRVFLAGSRQSSSQSGGRQRAAAATDEATGSVPGANSRRIGAGDQISYKYLQFVAQLKGKYRDTLFGFPASESSFALGD